MTPREHELYAAMKAACRDAFGEEIDAAVEAHMPEAIGEILAPLVHGAVRRDTRRWRTYASIGFLILALGLGYGIHDNRVRSTRARGVVCQIIVAGDQSLYTYEQEGSITHRQLLRALRLSAGYRKLLGPAPNCSTTLTPAPPHPPPPPKP